jgi:DNA-binding CsgD family transcriptional regulator
MYNATHYKCLDTIKHMLDFSLPNASLNNTIHNNKIQIPMPALMALINHHSNQFVFIKNKYSKYQYANANFIKLMGLTSVKKIFNQTNFELCRDIKKIKLYLQHDEEVLESGETLDLDAEVSPIKNKLINKQMLGNLYPIFNTNMMRTIGVLGIVTAQHKPFTLNLEEAILLTPQEFNTFFTRCSYSIDLFNQAISFSRREIQCMIELIKGKHAGEIAENLALKQSTVESYLINLKNKLGVNTRSHLIMTILDQKIIQKIIL